MHVMEHIKMARAAETTVGDQIARGGWVKHPVRCIFLDFDTAWPPSRHEESSWAIQSKIQSKPFAQQLCAKKTCKSCLPLMYRTAATQPHRSPSQMDKAGAAQHRKAQRHRKAMKFRSGHSYLLSWDEDEWSAFWSILRPGHSRINASEIYTDTTQMTTSSNALTPVLQKGLLHSNLWPFGLNGKVFWAPGSIAHTVDHGCMALNSQHASRYKFASLPGASMRTHPQWHHCNGKFYGTHWPAYWQSQNTF